MGLAKLTIKVEKVGSSTETQLVFGDSFEVLFNPDKLVFSKSANWAKQDVKSHTSPKLEFTNSEPRTLKLDLIYDTFDPAPENLKNKNKDVRKLYTDTILRLITVNKDEPRPPVCRLQWGGAGYFFQGALQQLEQQFTLFTEEGVPVRAKLSCTFKEWWTDYENLNSATSNSSSINKTHVVKPGETLSSIAADPKQWRALAVENGIDDPRELPRVLSLPTRPAGRR